MQSISLYLYCKNAEFLYGARFSFNGDFCNLIQVIISHIFKLVLSILFELCPVSYSTL